MFSELKCEINLQQELCKPAQGLPINARTVFDKFCLVADKKSLRRTLFKGVETHSNAV
jgi:hypothetical protein